MMLSIRCILETYSEGIKEDKLIVAERLTGQRKRA